LRNHSYVISVVNPFQIKAYGQAQWRRAKTDKADARLIADFGRTQELVAFLDLNPVITPSGKRTKTVTPFPKWATLICAQRFICQSVCQTTP
jgi:transposase